MAVNVGGSMQMLGGRSPDNAFGQRSQSNWGTPQQPTHSGMPPKQPQAQAQSGGNKPPMDFDTDIPF